MYGYQGGTQSTGIRKGYIHLLCNGIVCVSIYPIGGRIRRPAGLKTRLDPFQPGHSYSSIYKPSSLSSFLPVVSVFPCGPPWESNVRVHACGCACVHRMGVACMYMVTYA